MFRADEILFVDARYCRLVVSFWGLSSLRELLAMMGFYELFIEVKLHCSISLTIFENSWENTDPYTAIPYS